MGRRILLAEDDLDIRTLVAHTLEFEGYEVREVADGNAALAELEAHRPDCAILDIMMPGTDGIAVLEKIRATDSTREMPVIVLTAKGDSNTTWAGWRAGCDYYMSKPFEPEELLSQVARLIDRAGVRP